MSGARRPLVLATANPDKAAELAEVLGDEWELVARPPHVPEVEETGATLEANAALKAHALRDATGCAALADDTGLEVAALGGAPGIYAARYAGPEATYADNVRKLIAELNAVGATDASRRRARFRTVIVVAFPDGSEDLVAEGTVDGAIAAAPAGERGFGYDPVFVPDEGGGSTFAQMPVEAKHAISHRGRAVRAVAELLRQRGH